MGNPALTFSREAYEIKKGDIILIYAAAGGLGSLLTGVSEGTPSRPFFH